MDLENKKWKEEHPFGVPEGYFDRLESEILQKVELDTPVVRKGLRIRSLTFITSIAASLMLVIAAYVAWNLNKEPTGDDQYAETMEYILDNIDEFDLILISQMTSGEVYEYGDMEGDLWEDMDPENMDDELLELFFEM